MTFSLVPLNGSFAREVQGISLWQDIDDVTAEALRAAYRDNPLLVFRRQALEEDELIAFANIVGEPRPYAEAGWKSRFREIVLLSNMRDATGRQIGGLANQELVWHTDQCFYAEPVTGSILHAVLLPAEGGTTSWASLYGAYDALPMATKKIVDDAVGTFSYASRASYNASKDDNVSRAQRVKATPDVKHPLVNVNPATGRRSIYIDPHTVTGIDGMPDDEARDLLDELLAVATRPGNVYHHDWKAGDLVLWDNACLIHQREGFPESENRLVRRMIVRLPAGRHAIPPLVAYA